MLSNVLIYIFLQSLFGELHVFKVLLRREMVSWEDLVRAESMHVLS